MLSKWVSASWQAAHSVEVRLLGINSRCFNEASYFCVIRSSETSVSHHTFFFVIAKEARPPDSFSAVEELVWNHKVLRPDLFPQ